MIDHKVIGTKAGAWPVRRVNGRGAHATRAFAADCPSLVHIDIYDETHFQYAHKRNTCYLGYGSTETALAPLPPLPEKVDSLYDSADHELTPWGETSTLRSSPPTPPL